MGRDAILEPLVGRTPARRSSVGPQGVNLNLFVLKTWIDASFGLNKDEEGANLIEYILLIALIALLVIAAIKVLQPKINEKFTDSCKALNKDVAC